MRCGTGFFLLLIFSAFSAKGALRPSVDLDFHERNFHDSSEEAGVYDSADIEAVFFKREEGRFVPVCRPAESAEMLSADLPFSLLQEAHELKPATEEKPEREIFESTAADDLEECGPELSARLSAATEYFQLYPETAALPALLPLAAKAAKAAVPSAGAAISAGKTAVLAGVNFLSCFIAGGLTGTGVYHRITKKERQRRTELAERLDADWMNYFPTGDELLIGGGASVGSALGPLQTRAYWQALFPKENAVSKAMMRTATLGALGIGIVCSVSGGVVGYFAGRAAEAFDALEATQAELTESQNSAGRLAGALEEEYRNSVNAETNRLAILHETNQRIAALTSNIQEKTLRIASLEKELEATQTEMTKAQDELKAAQDELTKSQENLEKTQTELQESQNSAGRLAGALEEEYRNSVNAETNRLAILHETNQRTAALTSNIQEKTLRIASLEKELEATQTELTKTQDELKAAQDELTKSQENLEKTQTELQESQRESELPPPPLIFKSRPF